MAEIRKQQPLRFPGRAVRGGEAGGTDLRLRARMINNDGTARTGSTGEAYGS